MIKFKIYYFEAQIFGPQSRDPTTSESLPSLDDPECTVCSTDDTSVAHRGMTHCLIA